jgi:hypothetical protein
LVIKNPCLRVLHERRCAQAAAVRLIGLAGSRAALGWRCDECNKCRAVAYLNLGWSFFQFNDRRLRQDRSRQRLAAVLHKAPAKNKIAGCNRGDHILGLAAAST